MGKSNNMLMDRDKLLLIFDYLNEILKENQFQLELTIYGEAVMIIDRPLEILIVYSVMLIKNYWRIYLK